MAIVHFVNYKRSTQSRAAMRGVMLYVMQEKKTAWEGAPLISGINCQPQSVYDDFLNTKLLYHKDGGAMFYHMVQSFPKGAAVDPRRAHEAARRLAEYFDGCEVLVCTHVDREHIHSHCIINSVNFETGKKLHMAKEQIQELMRRNDAICQEMGLPVFEAAAQMFTHNHARSLTYFGFSLYHGTAVFVNCGKGQPPKAMGFWRRVVRPTGFEPAAFRVGVIRPSSRKALRRKGLVGVAQISAILEKNLGSPALQGFRGFLR